MSQAVLQVRELLWFGVAPDADRRVCAVFVYRFFRPGLITVTFLSFRQLMGALEEARRARCETKAGADDPGLAGHTRRFDNVSSNNIVHFESH